MTRTIVVDTLDHGPVEVDEPDWCIGHAWQRDIGRNDITHRSARVKAGAMTEEHWWLPVMAARIVWAPFSEPVPRVSVEIDVQHDFQAEDAARVAQGLRVAAMRIEGVAAQAVRLRGDLG